ncbi:hypothetical protein K9857_15040 [Pseudomonas sp. REP124]|uniref:hypothetical protein n=1 Tax=Pseudomonas sp. REP124 TaxID=2875731 RepID=UPI001CC9F9A9|nr:hypothetical protein [Pseudomonas sp. REP124]MBZ9782854.1 hypothetical protein [Pseudomonas sp. REP124]
MYENQRSFALSEWRKFLTLKDPNYAVEDQYYELLRRAAVMQKEGLISRLEWRQLVLDAGVFLSS